MKLKPDWTTGGKSADIGGKPMPAVSRKQKTFMQAVANNPAFAKKVGVPQSVGREFSKKEGGTVAKESKEMVKKEVAFMKKKGAPKSMVKHEAAEMGAMKKGGKVKKMAAGGYTRPADGVASKGKTKAKQVKMAYGGKC